MRLARAARIRGEGLGLLLIVLAILAGGAWFVHSSRRDAEKNCRVFATLVAERVAVNYDEKFLHVRLGPEAQVKFLQSARERLIARLRELGTPAQPIEVEGKVEFTSYFFKPKGTFRARLNYPNTVAYLDLAISSGMTVWQVDEINLTWDPPPTPTPTATPVPTPTATPTPKPKRRGR